MKIGKIILAAVVFTVLTEAINLAVAVLTMSYYMDPAYFSVWSKVMMPGSGPPPTTFYYYSIAFSFISGLIFVFVYSKIKDMMKNKDVIWNGKKYGIAVWLLAGVPSTLTMYLLVNIPPILLIYWNLSSLIIYVLSGISTAKILK